VEPLAQLIGESPGIAGLRDKIRRLLQRQSDVRRLPPVLIQGETGTGKGLLARVLHDAGARPSAPFVDVNCAAIPETLLEAEMFGYERGAFTDARQAKPGLFQTAHRGTIFLDEVGLLPEALQAKLLKVIEDHAVRRLGSTRSEPVDVWILAATSENLAAALRTRRFREDLYHRLAVVTVTLPPLRERDEDILRLARHFLARACADYGLPAKSLDPEAEAALLAYPWPGNLRELANVMERVALLSESPRVTREGLGLAPAGASPGPAPRGRMPGPRGPVPEPRPAPEGEGTAERDRLVAALHETRWNISRAALRLGLTRNTLRYRLEKYGLHTPDPARPPAASPPAGTPAPAVPATRPPEPGPPLPMVVRWERRHVTLLRAALDLPEAGASVGDQSRALAVLIEKAQSFGGRLEALGQTTLQAQFGLEAAASVEDAPSRAALAAMAMQRAAAGIRIALHTQAAPVGRVGETAALERDAARDASGLLDDLVARAASQEIVASEGAATFLARRFVLVPLADAPAARAYRLAGRERTGLGSGGRVTKFVGRRQELARLERCWAAAQQGRGQAVGIVGDAGLGKSRLVHEFRRHVGRRGVPLLRVRCAAYTQATALLPLLNLVRALCRMREDDRPETAREKLARTLATLGLAGSHLTALGEVLGLAPVSAVEPEERRRQAFEALSAVGLAGAALGRPVLVVVEDLHWVDRTSEEFLSRFLPRIGSVPLLFIFTYRPEYAAPWAAQPAYTQIPIGELAEAESSEILDALLPPGVPEETRRRILERARGNPFYLEEYARAAGEHGVLRPDDPVPDTIQDVIMTRIDRLPEEAKRVLQTASVLGREVSRRALGVIWGTPGAPLATLVRHGFLYERAGPDEPIHVFQHALTQEVAYASLPAPDRQALHAAAGRALEALYADRLQDVYDRLAYHYARTDQADKATLFLTRFAKRAARIHAHADAVDALQQALVHIERLPPTPERDGRLLDLVLRQARSLLFLGRSLESLALLLAQRARLDDTGDASLAARYYFLLARNLSLVGDPARAVRYAERAIEHARQCGDEASLGKACYVLAREAYWAGQPGRALEQVREAIAWLDRSGEQVWLGQAEWVLGVSQAFMGDFRAALETLARVEARGQALGDAHLVSYAVATIGDVRAVMGDGAAGIADCQRGVERSPDPLNRAFAIGCLGHAHLEQGDALAAIPLLDEARRQLREFGFRQMLGWTATWLGEARLANGELGPAADLVEESLGIARGDGAGAGLGFAQRLLGRIRRAEGRLAEARATLGQALETFTAHQAEFEVGRTHLQLAEAAHAAGDDAAAGRHRGRAAAGFEALSVPAYVARTAALAERLGVPVAALPG
jgi:DNA-binding NtrC family response regulator/tetratricopeptide (TPR) repeat protein